MKSSLILSLLAFFLPLLGRSQTEPKSTTHYNKDFRWTISIPAGYDSVNVERRKRAEDRGADAVERTYGTKVVNRVTRIFDFHKDVLNYFEANHQPFDPAEDGDYLKSFRNVGDVLYGTIQAEIAGSTFDSSYSTQVISGLRFQAFHVRITLPNNMVLSWWMYSRLFGRKDLTVNIVAVDEQREQELLQSWLNSKFDR